MPREDLDSFNEAFYLENNPDVAVAIATDQYKSGLEHFMDRGFRENRYPFEGNNPANTDFRIERLMLSHRGFVFLSGWCNDFSSPLIEITLSSGPYRVTLRCEEIYRFRRDDVEEALGLSVLKQSYDYGIFALFKLDHSELLKSGICVSVVTGTGRSTELAGVAMTTEEILCLHALTFVNSLHFTGDHIYHLFQIFERGFANSIKEVYVAKNSYHRNYTLKAFNDKNVKCSVITVLFGMHSPIRMIGSTAIATAGPEFEWIFANNSPELAHEVLQAARIVSGLYDASVKVINFNGNVGFGLANNVAAEHANGEILCIYNPDIVPIDSESFNEILKCSGDNLYGAVLHYADGTVMHNGMNFYLDRIYPGRSVVGQPDFHSAVRVEHLDKGAPPQFSTRNRNAELVAVSGALMVCSKSAFKLVGGFSETFIFGHYEDANLCLRWKEMFGNSAVQINYNINFVHLESKGSTGDKEPYRGAAKLNRWLFSKDPIVLLNAIE